MLQDDWDTLRILSNPKDEMNAPSNGPARCATVFGPGTNAEDREALGGILPRSRENKMKTLVQK